MQSKYPFADWLDGRVWLLRSNLDFLCLPVSIRGQAGSTWKPNLPAIPLGKIKKVMANNR